MMIDLESRFTRVEPLREESKTHIDVVAIGLGGSGNALRYLYRFCPELRDSLFAIDTDVKLEVDLGMLEDRLHLSSDGNFGEVLGNIEKYPFLKYGLPSQIKPWQTAQGVGMVRYGATVLLAYAFDVVRQRLDDLILRVASRFTGHSHKKLMVHLLFSSGGGTGSALAIPIAALVRHHAAGISETLEVNITAHCIGPSVYNSLLLTPHERERNYANSGMALRELYMVQNPENVQEYYHALTGHGIGVPLFDELVFYDIVDSGHGAQTRDQVWKTIAVNIAAASNTGLYLTQGARQVNPAAAQRGNLPNTSGTSIVASYSTAIARLPVRKLAQVAAGKVMLRVLRAATKPVRNDRDISIFNDGLVRLELDQTIEKLEKRVKPAEYKLNLRGLNTYVEIEEEVVSTEQKWQSFGRQALDEKVNQLAREFKHLAADNFRSFRELVRSRSKSIAEFKSALEMTQLHIEQTQSNIETLLERESRIKADLAHQKALGRLKDANRFRFVGRNRVREGAINTLREAFNQSIHLEAKAESGKVYVDSFLQPILRYLKAELRRIKSIERNLPSVQKQLVSQTRDAEETIGESNGEFTEVIQPTERAELIHRIVHDYMPHLRQIDQIGFLSLLEHDTPEKLRAFLQDHLSALSSRIESEVNESFKNLDEFATHFKLGFKLEKWLKSSVQLLLGSKFNLAVLGGAGHAPLRGYVVADPSLQRPADELLSFVRNARFEFVENNDKPFEIIVRVERSRIPFAGIPNIARIEKAWQNFETSNHERAHTIWSYLESHLLLTDAKAQAFPENGRAPDEQSVDELEDNREEFEKSFDNQGTIRSDEAPESDPEVNAATEHPASGNHDTQEPGGQEPG